MNIEIRSPKFLYRHVASENALRRFSMHVHNDYEILYFVEGNASFIVEDKLFKLHRDDLIIIRPQKYHCINFDGQARYERYNITFNSELLQLDDSVLPANFKVINCANKAVISDLFKRFDYYQAKFDREAQEELFCCLIKELVYNIARCDGAEDPDVSPTDSLMTEILNYVNINLFRIGSIKQIAQTFYISEVYVFKLFKQHLNISPLKYINKKKLLQAQSLIRNGAKPTEAGLQSGFRDYSTFYKNYLREFRHTPSDDYARTDATH